LKPLVNSLTGY